MCAPAGELACIEDVVAFRSDLQMLRTEVTADLRAAVADICKWVIGSQIALTCLFFAAIKLL